MELLQNIKNKICMSKNGVNKLFLSKILINLKSLKKDTQTKRSIPIRLCQQRLKSERKGI